ncbi:replication protein [bacterium]|nr:replication protein [bacterium]
MTEHDPESPDQTPTPLPRLTPTVQRLVDAHDRILCEPPGKPDYLHTVMCQVGMPRKATEARTFERHSGPFSILLEAGRLWNGRQWVEQPLPSGSTPRLVMVHLSTEAIRTQSRRVEIGDSMRQFLKMLGMPTSGGVRGGYAAIRRQMEALAACRLSIGMESGGKVVTVDAKPIHRFEAWLQQDEDQPTLWPGVLELSHEFFETLQQHAVPLDYRALSALKHSALALDVYTWLAHRLCRVNRYQGNMVSWANLREQFGQEYRNHRDFKREFRQTLRNVKLVYPSANIDEVMGGIILRPSPPPIPKTMISVPALIP